MPRIMLVDDEPNILKSLQRSIRTLPETLFPDRPIVEAFDSPESALARAADCEFHLVISDWRMPTMSGISFLNKLVEIQPGIARMILSAHGDFLSEVQAIVRINIFHFIAKPWRSDELGALMSQAIEHRGALLAHDDPPAFRDGFESCDGSAAAFGGGHPPFPWIKEPVDAIARGRSTSNRAFSS